MLFRPACYFKNNRTLPLLEFYTVYEIAVRLCKQLFVVVIMIIQQVCAASDLSNRLSLIDIVKFIKQVKNLKEMQKFKVYNSLIKKYGNMK